MRNVRVGSLIGGIVLLLIGGVIFLVGLDYYRVGSSFLGQLSSGLGGPNYEGIGLGFMFIGGIMVLVSLVLITRGLGSPNVSTTFAYPATAPQYSPQVASPPPIQPAVSPTSGPTGDSKFCQSCGRTARRVIFRVSAGPSTSSEGPS